MFDIHVSLSIKIQESHCN